MSCVLIFDSSTLILLAKSELLDLVLDDFKGTPLVPRAVVEETTFDISRPDAMLIKQRIEEGRLSVEEVRHSQILVRLLEDFRLGLGEAEALALASERDSGDIIATDDRKAIRACKVLRIGFVTSLAFLVRAVEKGLLTRKEGMRSLERLRSYGRFRQEVIDEVALQIGGTAHGESTKDG